MIDGLNNEKRVGKQNKVKQRHGSVKKKSQMTLLCIVFLSLLRRKSVFRQEIFSNWEGI